MAKLDIPAQQGAHGQAAALERMASTVPAERQPAQRSAAPVVQPFATKGPGSPGVPLGQEGDVSGGYDNALFAPSDRPHEPITHGAPFGEGANFVQLPYEDEYAFRRRIADELSKDPTPSLAPYIEKLRAGG